jgi:hypothetical protein
MEKFAYLSQLTDAILADAQAKCEERVRYWKSEIKRKSQTHRSDSSEQIWLSEAETELFHINKEIEKRNEHE